ncbi:4-alpha-glucanotransferase [Streptomyces sp. SceaMP-e96]|uniref:4-alpha-glucanotransferase n=1 Tax=unclassified Streptomyces TaxID=2593676 RepID=UPI000823AD98|nr:MULTISPECIES: 4-alpha-glucanotransferase [unclassified Streptomyces]MYT12491.1 4-alpha-glucanotransferase [Streptomyces sp. SID4951]SCK36877.1 4-alpha-glucanotransferase [Streptomyces sp. SceaMP-e96]
MGRARLARLHGIATSYAPSPGKSVQTADDTVVAVLAALGVDASTPHAVRTALAAYEDGAGRALLPRTVVARPDRPPDLTGLPEGTVLRVETEGGGTADLGAPDPAALTRLPLGIHVLEARTPGGRTARAPLIVAPDRVPAPPGRSHGFLVQLYSLLSRRSWGMGDLGDLADLAAWSGRALGTGFVQLNPLHAAVPGPPTDPSPYRPSSRRFPDPVHLRIEHIPEYADLAGTARLRADELAARAHALRSEVLEGGALIDRDVVWALKREALELLWAVPLSPGRRAAYCDFLAEQGQALEDHATWCAIAERHGPDWRGWPDGLRDPRSPGTARLRHRLLDRIDFHCRLAWLTDQQLAAAQRAARDAGMAIGLVHDLAVGVHPSGADTWAQQDAFAAGMSIGAPPDAFNARGQDWGLPPWRPDALAAAGYAPYRELLRGLLRHAGALRIDHVMGLFRLWWVPEGRPPTEGAYVRYDGDAMLSVLALEAQRAGAAVIGEDLGTVEPGVRDALAARGVLGTSVLWFERDYGGGEREAAPRAEAADAAEAAEASDGPGAARAPETVSDGSATGPAGEGVAAREAAPGPAAARILAPGEWRSGCLATVTTHDLPTTAARLTGADVALRERLGLLTGPPDRERSRATYELAEWMGELVRRGLLPEGQGDEEAAVKAVHRFLLRTPARMVGVWLPDAVGDRRPQNLPGTWDEYPNWRLPIAGPDGRPHTLEELAASPRLHALMRELSDGYR